MRIPFLILLLVWSHSCSLDSGTANRSETGVADSDSTHLSLKAEISTEEKPAVSKSEFILAEPNLKLIQERKARTGESSLYAYLALNYKTAGSKMSLNEDSGYEPECKFSQAFEFSILYSQVECQSGVASYTLEIPLISDSKVKKLFSVLFAETDYHWSKDSLSYKSSPDGLDGAGGEFSYIKKEDKLVTSVWFSD